ncbi:MAG: hypothetical protein AAF378_23545 [Cyanobacteria bacterium P01_A01_bin.84]
MDIKELGLADLIRLTQTFYGSGQYKQKEVDSEMEKRFKELQTTSIETIKKFHSFFYVNFYDVNTQQRHKLKIPVSESQNFFRYLRDYEFFLSTDTKDGNKNYNSWMSAWKMLNRYREQFEIKK